MRKEREREIDNKGRHVFHLDQWLTFVQKSSLSSEGNETEILVSRTKKILLFFLK